MSVNSSDVDTISTSSNNIIIESTSPTTSICSDEELIYSEITTNTKNKNNSFFKQFPLCNKEHGYYIKPKRYTLPIVGISGLIGMNSFQTFFYIPLFIFISSIILFWNFPEIILFNNKKPIYYDELFLDVKKAPQLEIDIKTKQHYERQFLFTLILMNSLLLAGLSDFWLYRTKDSKSVIEIAGITGGILKLFQYVNLMTGKCIIYLLRNKIKQDSNLLNEARIRGNQTDIVVSTTIF